MVYVHLYLNISHEINDDQSIICRPREDRHRRRAKGDTQISLRGGKVTFYCLAIKYQKNSKTLMTYTPYKLEGNIGSARPRGEVFYWDHVRKNSNQPCVPGMSDMEAYNMHKL
jgi:hypothetical protein